MKIHSAAPRRGRTRTLAALTLSGGLLASAGLAGLGPVGAQASSHREAPVIAGLPQYDTTDVYAFRSPDNPRSVTLIANWLPFSEPAGGPNFYLFADDARYNINIDNNGDNRPDVTYRWTFRTKYLNGGNSFLYANGPVEWLHDENLLVRQTYKLERVADGRSRVIARRARVAPSNVGEATMPDYADLRQRAVRSVDRGRFAGHRFFAGQAEDPFFLDLRVFDLLYGGDLSETGDDTLAGFNVNTVALSVPRAALAARGRPGRNPVIGVWSTTERRGVDGRYRQVSRLGMPLVNEVVIPIKDKDRWNASRPRQDGQFLRYVTRPELPKLLEAVYGIEAPAEPRNDLVSVFLTGVEGLNQPARVSPGEQLRLNMSTPITEDPERLGVLAGDNQGFPNGRRLADDVIDIALQVVAGELVGNPNDLGDAVDVNDAEFSDTFPFVALPVAGSEADPHPSGAAGAAPSSADKVEQGSRLAPASALAVGVLAMGAGAVGLLRRPRRTRTDGTA